MSDNETEHVPVIAVSVTAPEYRDGDSFITFQVSTYDTSLPTPENSSKPDLPGICSIYGVSGPVLTTVYRRFSSFLALRELLFTQYPACIIPPCPDKHFSLSGLDDAALADRCRRLHMFLARVSQHPVLAPSAAVQAFIYGDSNDVSRVHSAVRPALLLCEELVARAGGAADRDRAALYSWTFEDDSDDWTPRAYYAELLSQLHLDADPEPSAPAPGEQTPQQQATSAARYSVWNMLSATVETMQGLLATIHPGAQGGAQAHAVAKCDRECAQLLQWVCEAEERAGSVLRYAEELFKSHCASDDALLKVGQSFRRAAHAEAEHREEHSSSAFGVVARAAEKVTQLRAARLQDVSLVRDLCHDQQRWLAAVREAVARRGDVAGQLAVMHKVWAGRRDRLQAAVAAVMQERGLEGAISATLTNVDKSVLEDARVAPLYSEVVLLERLVTRQRRWVEVYTSQLLVEIAQWRAEFKNDTARSVRAMATLGLKWSESREHIWRDAVTVIDAIEESAAE